MYTMSSLPTALAYLDEAGVRQYVRDLKLATDQKFGLLGALVVPAKDMAALHQRLEPVFERFRVACEGKIPKLHITDAFASDELRPVAIAVRGEIFAVVQDSPAVIVYDALRLAHLRRRHAMNESLKSDALAARRNTSIQVSKNPSADRVEHDLMQGLALKLDALAEDRDWPRTDLHIDHVDAEIQRCLEQSLTTVRSVADNEQVIKAYDRTAGQPVDGIVRVRVTGEAREFNVTRIGRLTVDDLVTPLLFAADVILNSLSRHLDTLPPEAPLNAPSSIEGWQLAKLVYGVRDGAFEDLL